MHTDRHREDFRLPIADLVSVSYQLVFGPSVLTRTNWQSAIANRQCLGCGRRSRTSISAFRAQRVASYTIPQGRFPIANCKLPIWFSIAGTDALVFPRLYTGQLAIGNRQSAMPWLREKESNPHLRIQSPTCCQLHYPERKTVLGLWALIFVACLGRGTGIRTQNLALIWR